MTIQVSNTVKNGMLDAYESSIGVASILRFFTGAKPANTGSANTGTELWNKTLASDWAANASGGTKGFSATPISANAIAAGTIGYYRQYASDGTTCHAQGSVTATGGGGDLTVDNPVVASGQQVSVTSWNLDMNSHS